MENNNSNRGSVANLISKFGTPTQGHASGSQEKVFNNFLAFFVNYLIIFFLVFNSQARYDV